MTDVFISYRRSERARCVLIADQLATLGLDVWFDAELEGGQHFPDVINAKVREARVVLVLWSKTAIESQWVRAEAAIGLSAKKLVAAMLEDVDLPVPFNDVHTVDLTTWSGDTNAREWRQLVRPIERLVGRKLLPEAPPPPPRPARVEASAFPSPPPISRRTAILAGSAAAGVIGIGALGWLLWPRGGAATGQTSADFAAALDTIATEVLREAPEYATSLGVRRGASWRPLHRSAE